MYGPFKKEDSRLDQLAEARHGPVGEAHELGVALRHLELLVVQPIQRRRLTTGTPTHTEIIQGTEAWMGVPDDVRYRPIYARFTDSSLM
jgi:hypothetical protein